MKKITTLEQQEITAVNGACYLRPAQLFAFASTILTITMLYFINNESDGRKRRKGRKH